MCDAVCGLHKYANRKSRILHSLGRPHKNTPRPIAPKLACAPRLLCPPKTKTNVHTKAHVRSPLSVFCRSSYAPCGVHESENCDRANEMVRTYALPMPIAIRLATCFEPLSRRAALRLRWTGEFRTGRAIPLIIQTPNDDNVGKMCAYISTCLRFRYLVAIIIELCIPR